MKGDVQPAGLAIGTAAGDIQPPRVRHAVAGRVRQKLVLIEFDEAAKIFTNPSKKATEDYITGRYG